MADRSLHDGDEDASPGGLPVSRQFAAWLGLTPKNHSTIGKVRLGVLTRA
jgi:transposase